jgi:hypothetical protein
MADFWKIATVVNFALLGGLTLLGLQAPNTKTRYAELDVERLNVVEPSGRVRLVLSNKPRSPAGVIGGKTVPGHEGTRPGVIFYNDDGDECGGLVFGNDGPRAGAGFFFDQFHQDQTVGVVYQETNGKRMAGVRVWDRGETPLVDDLDNFVKLQSMPDGPEKRKLAAEVAGRQRAATRVFIGKTEERDAKVVLSDDQGRPRLALVVSAAGAARIDFLDEKGKTTGSFPR